MKTLITLLLFGNFSFAQNTLDNLKWYLAPTSQTIKIDIDDLHSETITATPEMDWGWQAIRNIKPKKQIKIAVIDTGLDIAHKDIKDFILYNEVECYDGTAIPPLDELSEDKDSNGYKADCIGWNFVNDTNLVDDDQGHGTHVAGVITNVLRDHSEWFKILPIKVFSSEESKNSANSIATLPRRLEKSIQYAMEVGVDIIHFSSGWPNPVMTRGLQQALNTAIDSGVAVISAAGNSSQRANIWPCRENSVICVGALRANGEIARFSNWGNQVDLFAPGEKILSPIPMTIAPEQIKRKGYDYKNGTSQSAPIVTASFAVLKSINPKLSNAEIYSKLLMTAKALPGFGVRGLLQVDKAMQTNTINPILPSFKGLNTLEIKSDGHVKVTFPIKNIHQHEAKTISVSLNCENAQIERDKLKLSLNPKSNSVAEFIVFPNSNNDLTCEAFINDASYLIQGKLLKQLPNPKSVQIVDQSEMKLIYRSAASINVRIDTVKSLKDAVPQALYYVTGQKDLTIYKESQKLGVHRFEEGCKQLRVWQSDINLDQQNDFIIESICHEEYLHYEFIDQSFSSLYEPARYKPMLTLIDYDNFKIIPQADAPPILEFINTGLMPLPTNPWEPISHARLPHLYNLTPHFEDGVWEYKAEVKEDHKAWQQQLGLRYLPTIYTLHHVDNTLLIKVGEKTAWVDLETQTARWAELDEFIIEQNKLQSVFNSNLKILQANLTPYDYRGVILDNGNKITLRAKQEDIYDPFMDSLSTLKTMHGYISVVRSFLNIWTLKFNSKGELIHKTKSKVDTFDFLTALDMLALIQQVYINDKLYHITDASNFISDYVDVTINETRTTYKVPRNCTTQKPVKIDGQLNLPLFCVNKQNQFVMKFMEL